MIQSAVMGALTIVIGGDVSDLDKAVAKAQGTVGKLTKGVNAQAAQLAAYATAATAAGAALAVGLLAKSMQTIDAQSKLAARLNGSVAELQALTHAADLAGISQEALASSVGRMNQKLAEAARTGQGPAYEALQRLGLSAGEFLALPVNERLATLADRFKALGYNTAQQADALKQMGVRGQELISLFEGGGDGIRDATKDVEAFGVAMSDVDAAAIEAANDAWTTAKLLLTGIGNQLAKSLAPIIKETGDQLADAGRQTGGFSAQIDAGVKGAIVVFSKLNREVYDARVGLDEFAADFIRLFDGIAGAIPKGIETATGGAVTAAQMGFKPIAHSFGVLREHLELPPDSAEWLRWYDEIAKKAKEAAEKVVAERRATNTGSGDTGDGMTEQERKSQQDKLDRLKRSIANEDEQLRMQRDKQLREIAEFEQKKIATATEAAALRLAIEDKYRKDLQALVQARFEESVATEDEQLAKRYEKQLADLALFEANKTLTVEKAAELRRKIEERAKLASVQLQAAQYSALANIVDTTMSDITSLVGEEGDKQFSIFKAISAATALVKGYEAVVSAYAAGSKIGGPAVGAIFAGIAAAGVAAHIAKLMAVSTGGGAGGASVAASGGGGGEATAAARHKIVLGRRASGERPSSVAIELRHDRDGVRARSGACYDDLASRADLRFAGGRIQGDFVCRRGDHAVGQGGAAKRVGQCSVVTERDAIPVAEVQGATRAVGLSGDDRRRSAACASESLPGREASSLPVKGERVTRGPAIQIVRGRRRKSGR